MIRIGETAKTVDLLELPNCRFSVDGVNVIVERNVSKEYGYGTVKESFGQGDKEIILAGTIVAKDRDPLTHELYPPYEQIQAIAELMVKGKALRLLNSVTSAMGIDRVVVYSYSWPDTPGQNRQYIIRCKTDYPFELIVDADRQS